MITIDKGVVRQPRRVDLQLGLRGVITTIEAKVAAEDEDPRATPEAVSPERWRLANAGIKHLSPIVTQLVELWKEPERDEYGRLRPTQEAFDKTVHLLVDAAIETYPQERQIPFGCVSTDSEGGVRIEWIRPEASVHLVVPASKERAAYVYHKLANKYGTEDVTPDRLSYWLRIID